MKVLILAKYGELAASTRYRFTQYVPSMRSAGIESVVSPLLDDAYLKERFSLGKSKWSFLIAALYRRTAAVWSARNFDLVVVHCELFPYLPPIFELFLKVMKIPYIYDFDDAIFHQYNAHPNYFVRLFYSSKIKYVIKWSRGVIAGSSYLAAYANDFSSNVQIIPTVIDIEKYEAVAPSPKEEALFTIGWIGSPSTAFYVKERASIFRKISEICKMRLVLIGSGPLEIPGVDVVVVDWSELTEIQEIKKFDVGIMPLSDSLWSRGKCGFKLIQYMASSLPVVASAVGENQTIVQHGVNGFLATTDEEWCVALKRLKDDPTLREKMGGHGLNLARNQYSLQACRNRVNSFLLQEVSNGPRA